MYVLLYVWCFFLLKDKGRTDITVTDNFDGAYGGTIKPRKWILGGWDEWGGGLREDQPSKSDPNDLKLGIDFAFFLRLFPIW